ncbi:MAG: type I-U CRISPR-associated protein Cas5/Cas6 [Bryobacteraceae bacterium]|nr:type I-U CRISPR-associated protein Cas5/Cas6 [Bryobacteraceae bacterium]
MRISVDVLGRAHAFTPEGEREWPFYPSRLFCSAVAAVKQARLGTQAEDALRWLERLPSPQIGCPAAAAPGIVETWVPSNYSRFRRPHEILPWLRNRQLREVGAFSVFGPIDYQWPEVNAWPEALGAVIEHISRIGRSDSLVSASIFPEPVEPNLVPGRGRTSLGVPRPGYLQMLEEAYRRGLRPAPPAIEWYGPPGSAETVGMPAHGEMIVLGQAGGDIVGIEDSLLLTDSLRKGILRVATERGLLIPELHGHEPSSKTGKHHCAFLALPNVGHAHADGFVKGVAVVLPTGIDADARWRIYCTLAQLTAIHCGRKQMTLAPATAIGPATLRAETWIGPSRTWTSVTPILFRRRPSLKFDRAREDLIAAYCLAAGLPEPLDIACQAHPACAGTVDAREYRLARKPDERQGFGFHATIRFARRVRGPIFVGRWRHFGLGLLRPVSSPICR